MIAAHGGMAGSWRGRVEGPRAVSGPGHDHVEHRRVEVAIAFSRRIAPGASGALAVRESAARRRRDGPPGELPRGPIDPGEPGVKERRLVLVGRGAADP